MDNFWKKWQKLFSTRNIASLHVGGNTEPQDIAESLKRFFIMLLVIRTVMLASK